MADIRCSVEGGLASDGQTQFSHKLDFSLNLAKNSLFHKDSPLQPKPETLLDIADMAPAAPSANKKVSNCRLTVDLG